MNSELRWHVSAHGADECSITLWFAGGWHDLMAADDPEWCWATFCGIPGVLPRGALLPRADGLAIVHAARRDGPGALRAAHRWRPVPAWVSDRGGYLVRDVCEALHDAAGDQVMRMVRGEPAPDGLPIGVRRLAYLVGVHDQAMANGFGETFERGWWPEAIAALDELGLPELAAVLRRYDPATATDDSLLREYYRLTLGDDDPIRDALRRRVRRVPEEYNVDDPPPLPSATYEELLPTGALREFYRSVTP